MIQRRKKRNIEERGIRSQAITVENQKQVEVIDIQGTKRGAIEKKGVERTTILARTLPTQGALIVTNMSTHAIPVIATMGIRMNIKAGRTSDQKIQLKSPKQVVKFPRKKNKLDLKL